MRIHTKILTHLYLSIFLAAPNCVVAANGEGIESLLERAWGLLDRLYGVLILLGLLGVLYSGYLLMKSKNAPESKLEHTEILLWGILGLVFMVSVWGIVEIFSNTFDIQFGGNLW